MLPNKKRKTNGGGRPLSNISNNLVLDDSQLRSYTLAEIEHLLQCHGKSMHSARCVFNPSILQ